MTFDIVVPFIIIVCGCASIARTPPKNGSRAGPGYREWTHSTVQQAREDVATFFGQSRALSVLSTLPQLLLEPCLLLGWAFLCEPLNRMGSVNRNGAKDRNVICSRSDSAHGLGKLGGRERE